MHALWTLKNRHPEKELNETVQGLTQSLVPSHSIVHRMTAGFYPFQEWWRSNHRRETRVATLGFCGWL
jgi:hypothetical protein